MTDNDNDIDPLLAYLKSGHTPHWYDDSTRWHAALIALVAERDALVAERDKLREQLRLANIDQCNTEAEANDRDRDLRERLVCAALIEADLDEARVKVAAIEAMGYEWRWTKSIDENGEQVGAWVMRREEGGA